MLLRLRRQPRYLRFEQLRVNRRPHWRYALAVDFEETSRDPEVRQDHWMRLLWQVLDQGVVERSRPTSETVQNALEIWRANDHRRWELEARILAKQQARDVAAAMDFPVLTVDAYEALFFDIRGYLAKRDYIAGVVIRTWKPFRPDDVGQIWRHYSYFSGLTVLESLVDHFHRRGWKDYFPLFTDEPRVDRSDLDAAIERDLLLALLPSVASGEYGGQQLAAAADELLAALQEEATVSPVAEFAIVPGELPAAAEAIVTEAMLCSRESATTKQRA